MNDASGGAGQKDGAPAHGRQWLGTWRRSNTVLLCLSGGAVVTCTSHGIVWKEYREEPLAHDRVA